MLFFFNSYLRAAKHSDVKTKMKFFGSMSIKQASILSIKCISEEKSQRKNHVFYETGPNHRTRRGSQNNSTLSCETVRSQAEHFVLHRWYLGRCQSERMLKKRCKGCLSRVILSTWILRGKKRSPMKSCFFPWDQLLFVCVGASLYYPKNISLICPPS